MLRAQKASRQAEERGQVLGPDASQALGLRAKVGGQGLIRGGGSRAEMEDATRCRNNRAKIWVATATQSNDLTTHTIFLCGELKGNKGGAEKLGGRSSGAGKGEVTQE